jgi:8-oxo-dGTP diphosphatase
MENFRIAVKAFILKNNKVLLLKRRSNDVHKPGTWDIPGGRLEMGENPYDGLQREVNEETGLKVEIAMPLDIHHFVRDDGQKITMLIFLCKPLSNDIELSEEHEESSWIDVAEEKENIPEWLIPTMKNLEKVKTELI